MFEVYFLTQITADLTLIDADSCGVSQSAADLDVSSVADLIRLAHYEREGQPQVVLEQWES